MQTIKNKITNANKTNTQCPRPARFNLEVL